ncbi:Histidine ammonia-lyase, putative [Perkinsus marinus ATCC 50983]|uniref:Histidine ammonia-lyase, putative n=1 Tax=Perkinsus marinus (strain ATCC 50983 / TXsc) TaxID=423536 RepID=C5K9W7_PERM5|nr:Histidine ammonia-lyase, putative [Perkinsus marinus ATCC 50983]EER18889.1 Histidine ammonia-lyase, putative [Perkinsus marinus ATCC 50983]|eukprot:XP_002787093.1 Histidine ammonia-lyase, putative [Perkinsus marinus ATCC 50983]
MPNTLPANRSVGTAAGILPSNPPTERTVCVLDGHSLTCEKLMELSTGNVELTLSAAAWDKVNRGRHVIDQILDKNEVAYGINTGFGMFSDVIVAPDQLSQLQVNLIRSHAAGVGPPLSRERTRMLLALRVNVIACGHSGARPETVEKMLAAFNKDCLSVVPCQGTVGASGDLAPLAHLCLGLLGEGLMWDPQSAEPKPAGEVLERHGLEPLQLGPKEGLALINGTQLISSLGSEAVMRSINVARCADITCALSLEVLMGTHNAFHPKIHAARPHSGQNLVASRIRGLLEPEKPSKLFESHRYSGKVQDAYTLRCVAQVHGVVFETIDFVKRLLEVELNSATDNPMIFTGGADFYPTGSAKAPVCTRGRIVSGDGAAASKGSAATTPAGVSSLSPIHSTPHDSSLNLDDSFPLLDGPDDASDISDLNGARKEIQKMRALLKNFKQENTALNTHLMETLLLGTSGFIISGGNFHGEYPAKALDYLAIGIQELANISERRMERLVNPALSNLPAFLVQNGGLNSGFMIAHCTAAALTSENKVLCHPSSVDTLSTSAAKEDLVSLGEALRREVP